MQMGRRFGTQYNYPFNESTSSRICIYINIKPILEGSSRPSLDRLTSTPYANAPQHNVGATHDI